MTEPSPDPLKTAPASQPEPAPTHLTAQASQSEAPVDHTAVALGLVEPLLVARAAQALGGSDRQLPGVARIQLAALRRDPKAGLHLSEPRFAAARAVVAQQLVQGCFDDICAVLGDNQDNPTLAQLTEAVGAVRPRYPSSVVNLTLALVADDGDAPASPLCAGLLADDPVFAAAQAAGREHQRATETAGKSRPHVSTRDKDERAARRRAQAAQRRQQAERSAAAHQRLRQERKRKNRSEAETGGPPGTTDALAGGVRSEAVRRRPLLTPAETDVFHTDDPRVGTVVTAEIPFTSGEPHRPETGSDRGGKWRPCVVVGVSDTELLVRAGYSEGGLQSRLWKSVPLRWWRQAGLDKQSWIANQTHRISLDKVGRTVGTLVDEDWNALW